MARAILLFGLIFPLTTMQPAAAAPAQAGDASAAVEFVRSMLDGMVEISRRPTRDRRAFYESLIRNDIDWNGPAMRALGSRWNTLSEGDRRKLADWSRDSLLDAGSVMEFIQNLVFGRCDITGREPESGGATVRFSCNRFGNEPSFSLRMQVLRRGDRFQIADVGYIGVSLIEAMGEALRNPEAIAKHGVSFSSR